MKLTHLAAAVLLHLAAGCHLAFAQYPDHELDDLRHRIEALEQQNEALRQSLEGQTFDSLGPSFTHEETAEEKSTWNHSSLPCEDCPPCEEEDDHLKMSASWHHGLEIATEDEDFRIHIGGRTQFDASWFAADENVQDNINNPYEDGVDFRRGRIRIDGTMYSTIEFAAEYDFFGAARIDGEDRTHPAPTDLWWTFKEVPWVGNIRVGNQKPAIGFEHLVSSRFLPFMERSYNQDAFYGGGFNGFWPGISFFDTYGGDDFGVWNIGVFKPTDNIFAASAFDGDYAVVGRLTCLPWYACNGAELLHLGGSVSQHTTVEDRIVFRTRDAIRAGLSSEWPVPASTGIIAGDDMQWINGELVGVNGPWTLQSEYLVSYLHDAAPIIANVVQPSVGTTMYHGGYVQVLYFITGERDNYNKKTGAFDRVIPHSDFYFRDGYAAGTGAWQVGARYNFLDLNDNTLDGGILHNFTGGLNWFLNPNMKIQFNYMVTDRDAALSGDLGDGLIHGWGIRFAHDF
jgi:phosphate-selective porin OprO/OprP